MYDILLDLHNGGFQTRASDIATALHDTNMQQLTMGVPIAEFYFKEEFSI